MPPEVRAAFATGGVALLQQGDALGWVLLAIAATAQSGAASTDQ